MRFIHIWSYMCANFLMKQLNENHEKRRVYYYGFQIVIGAIVKGVLLVTSALLLGTLLPTLFLVLVFGSFRMLAGGYHMDTYGKCILTSLAMFILFGGVAQYTYTYWNTIQLIILVLVSFISGLVAVIKWAPSDTPNKPITSPEEIRKFKSLSITYCIVWMMVIFTAVILGIVSILPKALNMYIIAACLGFLLEAFTITPAGIRFFDIISGKITRPMTNKLKNV